MVVPQSHGPKTIDDDAKITRDTLDDNCNQFGCLENNSILPTMASDQKHASKAFDNGSKSQIGNTVILQYVNSDNNMGGMKMIVYPTVDKDQLNSFILDLDNF